jgi:hypothetical protein
MKQFFEPTHLANTVRLLRTQFHGVVLFVEGASDKRVYGQFTVLSSCRVMVADGKSNVLETLDRLRDVSGMLGIVDADFERHAHNLPLRSNVVVTDLHDLECIMCASPAFDKLLNEFGEEARVAVFREQHGESLADVIANRTATIGFLRWISICDSLELDFDELTYSHFVGRNDLKIDANSLVVEVVNHSRKHHLDQAELVAKIQQQSAEPFSPWQVCCGHDVLELLSFAVQKTIAARKASDVGRESLERALRLAYEPAFFVKTSLYRDVVAWQSQQSTQLRVFEKLEG